MACITNTQYVEAATQQATAIRNQATADAAIQVGIALWQRNSSQSISNMQMEIADRQMKLAEEVEAHAELFWPEETELVNDTFGVAKTTTQYTALTSEFGGLVDGSLQQGRAQWLDTMRKWCMAPTRCEDARWQRNSQLARADLMSFAARQDEARTQILNDRRYARQLAVLQLGRGLLRELLSYQAIGQTSGMYAGSMLTDTVNSALTAFGYYPNRHEQAGWGSGIRETWAARNATAPMPVSVVQQEGSKLGDGLRIFDREVN